ncbi:hypothetical protein AL073_12600 [Loktanella sp. 1ANDIMAR09]|nr:hypothetical protein AL073_12600 [Loktanella sp. 1ANDIMAR09]
MTGAVPIRTTCRVCGSKTEPILDLGESPLANALLHTPDVEVPYYPLGLCACTSCNLVQQRASLPTDLLFDDAYPYFSGVSTTIRAHAKNLAKALRTYLPTGSRVLEVGSNDGTTQRALTAEGLVSVGVDPAAGPVAAAKHAGCTAYCGAMDAEMAEMLGNRHGSFDAVTMSNVFAHVPDPCALLSAVCKLMKDDGLLVIEVQSWLDLVDGGSWDMVYHEHHCHFSLSSLATALKRANLGIEKVQHIDAQSGSLRAFCRLGRPHAEHIDALIASEAQAVATAPARLSAQLSAFRHSLATFADMHTGQQVVGYGAAAKTVTLLAAAGGRLELDCVADAAPSKIGKYLPIGGVPIIAPDELSKRGAKTVVLFARNLKDEIIPTLAANAVWSPLPSFTRIA